MQNDIPQSYVHQYQSERQLTATELNAFGKIVENPPGTAPVLPEGWVWQLGTGTRQTSNSEGYFITLAFEPIEDTPANRMLYEAVQYVTSPNLENGEPSTGCFK